MKLDDVKKLQQKKYREQFGHFLVEGEHLVLELQKAAQHAPLLASSELYVTAAYEHWQSPFRTHLISDRQMAQIADTKTPQGIIAVVPMAAIGPGPSAPAGKAIYLHEIQDPGNLGTILRSLAWFGGFRCLLSPGSVDPFNPKVVRASMGAIFHTPIEQDVSLDNLSTRFARIACLDMQGQSLRAPAFAQAECYLFGNEARGVPSQALSELNATPFTIAGSGAIESLNLASTVNICVYELSR
ncbi:TrmH family RNA methyltransferase [Ectopseudomonas oleovorans]|jgi:TrmH family RNA methyltransferase|uniref:RNA methyltransferase n=1 Tax=Ectopseudomonas oleovorans TaxID=301 RepID=A0AA42Q7M3_ECTOL|nr:RNA methyltransferase [Pseudomonas oleovorans]KFJ92437.1 rRNA methyltransferase [Pseudomonas sp. 1-7]MBP8883077.1 RNA methyltransferase [Pseudomonas sp.]MDH1338737.1 RNA methyltransferase [Pseudomonas oleovorans]MDH1492604.1 RNA methyltransferase [Pseudomonas oleovorans]PZP83260.1 MAG: RNA methyltransferase [Pseudomonas oleovorans]